MADDQEVRLTTILQWLEQGKISTDQAAERVRRLHFPVPEQPSMADRLAEHHRGDIALPQAGSFAEISAAYAAGRITRPQYTVLAHAAHAAMADGEVKLSGQDGNVVLGRATHEQVDYERPSSQPDQTCGNCYMMDDGHCTLVEDPIYDDGRCTRWLPSPVS